MIGNVGQLAKALWGMSIEEAHEKGVCVKCRLPAEPQCYSKVGRTEYQITGLCELCFDAIVGPKDLNVQD